MLYSPHQTKTQRPHRKRAAFVLCSVVLDELAKAFGIDPASAASIPHLAQAMAFDGALLDEFVKPGTAYAETIAGIADAEIFDGNSSECVGS